MTEQRSIAYNSIGFTLGLGGTGCGTAPPKAASSSFLDTLISSVPTAKALLPNLAPDLFRAKTAEDNGAPSQRNEGLSSYAGWLSTGGTPQTACNQTTSPKQPLAQPEIETQRPKDESGCVPREPSMANAKPPVIVISLLSDSESDMTKAAAPKVGQATATSAEVADLGDKDAKPVMAEFIPLPPSATTKPATTPRAAAPGSADELAEQEDIRRLGQRPYWMSYVSRIDSPLLRLHQELVELCELVQPTPEEAAARREAVAVVSEVVRSIWPQARCEIFGSYATGLYVPTSDIDLVILDSGCSNVQSGLKALGNALNSRKVAQNIQVVGKARVPIVKFETVDYGHLAFDVSFDVANGPQAALLVKEMTTSWPMMRPLILCLKLFLQQRELNEVYTGGIGSYALVTLVAAFLQLHGSRKPKGPQPAQPVYGTAGDAALPSCSGGVEPGLGTLVVDFFRFYGRVVNINDVGISCAAGGQFFRKVDKDAPDDTRSNFVGWLNEDRAFLLSVEDPKDSDNDVCRNSFNIMRIKTAFEYAYQVLTAPSRCYESLLARILRLGPILASRPRNRVPHLRESGYYTEPPGKGEPLEEEPTQLREHQRNERMQQESPGAHKRKDSGRGSTPGGGGAKKKRGRDSSGGGGGGDSVAGRQSGKAGKASGKTPRTPKGLRTQDAAAGTVAGNAAQGKETREEILARRKERKAQRKQEGRRGSVGGDGEANGGGKKRPQKRRREEPPNAAAAGGRGQLPPVPEGPADAAAGVATPARSAKRVRVEGRQQKQPTAQKGRRSPRETGSRPAQQPDRHEGQQQQQQPTSHGNHYHHAQQHNHHHHQSQGQPQRRPALVTVQQQQQQQPVQAPIFHPGYFPPPQQHNHRHHSSSQHHHHSDHGAGGGSNDHRHHHHGHHSHGNHHNHHQSYGRSDSGYYGGDPRGSGYNRDGDSGGGYGGAGSQGYYSRGPPPIQQQDRSRAPIALTQQQFQARQPRGSEQRSHVFFD
ncbi:hypothetical protein VaNZ11_006973 [Volvox africanus]|uniref:Polymerase nucleotidyl transferase domain-containing protein n=1 Tax=Volvox africanus TaxID=51714 RepID=A0ABQ5S304_9CHLO|nr:hypothetical protein VaNZ11_006973 [Volvox africanus]